MYTVKTKFGKVNIVENASELPRFEGVKKNYLDVETTHFDKYETRKGKDRKGAFRPYNGDRICGVAVTRDDEKEAWYVPIRHTDEKANLPQDVYREWLRDAVTLPKEWVNHNVKYDAHFCVQDGAQFTCELTDTLTEVKMHDSERYGHGLKDVVRDLCGRPMENVDEVQTYLRETKSSNYASVPVDILGAYAGVDVLGNRELHKFLQEEKEEQIKEVWKTERKLTQVLYDMENEGLKINIDLCKVELFKSLKRMILWSEQLEELTKQEYVDSNNHLFDIFVVQLGLPILAYTKTKDEATGRKVLSTTPSFDKDALAMYSIHPQVLANEKAKRTVELVLQFRKETTFKGLFLEAFLDRADANGYVHPMYNQIIRTGRMSCAGPNFQQLNKRAKALVVPEEGEAFADFDASQIEFRILVHYIKDYQAIQAYKLDPKTDFHQWVADLCHVQRYPAKSINFAMGYGAGKRRVLNMLRNDPSIMKEVGAQVRNLIVSGAISENASNTEYIRLCEERAKEIYQIYHERLPGIKRKSKIAEENCERRGFSFNAYGRRRHLGSKFAWRAFNTIIQGTAGDYVKNRMVEMSPRWNVWMKSKGIKIRVNVHDAILFSGCAIELKNKSTTAKLNEILEIQFPKKFEVPFIWSSGYSVLNWAEAG